MRSIATPCHTTCSQTSNIRNYMRHFHCEMEANHQEDPKNPRNTWDKFKRKHEWLFGSPVDQAAASNIAVSPDTNNDELERNGSKGSFGADANLFVTDDMKNKATGMPDFSNFTPQQMKDNDLVNKEWQKYFLSKRDEFKMHCDTGSMPACTSLAEFYYIVSREPKRAEKILKPVCFEHKHAHGCFWLGNIYSTGDGVPPDSAAAFRAFKIGCDGGDGSSCSFASKFLLRGLGVPQNTTSAMEYAQIACESYNDSHACSTLAMLHAGAMPQLEESKRNKKIAAKYFKLACELNDKNACYNLSLMYKLGEGVAKNEKKREYFMSQYEALVKLGV